jgi:hypothetical protein
MCSDSAVAEVSATGAPDSETAIEVTPKMIDAGADEFRSSGYGNEFWPTQIFIEDVLPSVFRAMVLASDSR